MREAKRPLIVIGVPCYGTVSPELLEDWMRWSFHLGRRMPEYDFQIAIKSKSEQFRARNTIVDAAQAANADYLLMIDDDMIINVGQSAGISSDYDFLRKLVAHDVDICGILYYQRTGECKAVVMNAAGDNGYRFLRDDEILHDLQKVDVAGGGLLLIKMRVFDKLKAPYFVPEFEYGTDIQLCRNATEAGFEVWVDTSIEFGHVREERVIVTSRNRHQFQTKVPDEVTKFIATEVFDKLVDDVEEYTDIDRAGFEQAGQFFHTYIGRSHDPKADAEMYAKFPLERIVRQTWFNTTVPHKRAMTEFILSTVDHTTPRDILDFGCGIGIPAFALAEKGHRVTATDLPNTGTYQFLQYRAEKHEVPITFRPLIDGKVPYYHQDGFDIIIAMDCLEHIEDWRGTLKTLADNLKPNGFLFANNAVLDDVNHPEHYDCKPADFIAECARLGLMPVNNILYFKKVVVTDGSRGDGVARGSSESDLSPAVPTFPGASYEG